MKTSELFPVIVEWSEGADPGSIVLEALRTKWPGYTPKDKSYYVVPLIDVTIVHFKPKVDYEIFVEKL